MAADQESKPEKGQMSPEKTTSRGDNSSFTFNKEITFNMDKTLEIYNLNCQSII